VAEGFAVILVNMETAAIFLTAFLTSLQLVRWEFAGTLSAKTRRCNSLRLEGRSEDPAPSAQGRTLTLSQEGFELILTIGTNSEVERSEVVL